MIEAKIIKDSVAPSGIRLTTFVLTYPRFIHAEFMTHRMFSRNASSSRAIPVKKSIQMVLDNPVVPLAFTRNKAGMQGGDPLDEQASKNAEYAWLTAMGYAVKYAQMLADLDVHKQYANRILEPFAHITVVCTATDYDNFFALRCHEMAQPEIHVLADLMYDARQKSTPQVLQEGQWHLPFISDEDADAVVAKRSTSDSTFCDVYSVDDILLKMSVARCARVSYLNHEGKKPTIDEDLQLYNRLVGSAPIHASPAEHQAKASSSKHAVSGNFRGWIQYRKTLANENIEQFNGPEDK